MKKLVIVTGLSGSGKSLAANAFEDINFFVADNITPEILPVMAKELASADYNGFAAVIDSRCRKSFFDLVRIYENLKSSPIEGYETPCILFLTSKINTILCRFKETRRKHPLSDDQIGIIEAIKKEQKIFQPVLDMADIVMDTSLLENEVLRNKIKKHFGTDLGSQILKITVSAFGFKYGMPLDADLVFDVRFLKNPFWEPKLREFTGRDQCVKDYIFSDKKSQDYMQRLYSLVDFSVPEYAREGKAYLNIAVGCTGGKHRSVAVAQVLAEHLEKKGYKVIFESRDN